MMKQVDASSHHSGFTLLEVLIATALFALSSTALVQVVLNTLSALNAQPQWSSDTVDQAFVIDQIEAIDTRSSLEEGGTLTSPSGQVVHWSASNEPTEIIDLHAIELRLEWQPFQQRPAREDFQKLYWYRPWLSEPSERAARIQAKKFELATP
ncbi:MAG: prepilin-type N-terminal cleavage/methylation domain-containing protein [Opitutales bacterium]